MKVNWAKLHKKLRTVYKLENKSTDEDTYCLRVLFDFVGLVRVTIMMPYEDEPGYSYSGIFPSEKEAFIAAKQQVKALEYSAIRYRGVYEDIR